MNKIYQMSYNNCCNIKLNVQQKSKGLIKKSGMALRHHKYKNGLNEHVQMFI